jgi:hypothetical protein
MLTDRRSCRYLVSAELSDSYAFGYDVQFFLAIAVGIVGLNPRQNSAASEISFDQLRPVALKTLTNIRQEANA